MTKLEKLIVESFHPSLHDVLLQWARDPRKGRVADKLRTVELCPVSAVAAAYFAPHVRIDLRGVPASRLRIRRGSKFNEPIIFAEEIEEQKKRPWHWLFAA